MLFKGGFCVEFPVNRAGDRDLLKSTLRGKLCRRKESMSRRKNQGCDLSGLSSTTGFGAQVSLQRWGKTVQAFVYLSLALPVSQGQC